MAPVYAELESNGFLWESRLLGPSIDSSVSRSGGVLDEAALALLSQRIDRGYTQFINGSFDSAALELEAAQALLRSRPATVARTQTLRDSVVKLQIALALTYQRQGRAADSTAALAEFLRSFPDKEISRAKYGPEPAALASAVRDELARRPAATLRIQVAGNRAATIFVQERYVGVKDTTLTDLYAGRYRVYVQTDTPGRVHDVEVTPGSDQTLTIDWSLDSTLRTDSWVGFQYEDELGRATGEAANASAVGQKLGATEVVVLGIHTFEGRKAIVGSVVEVASARPVRTAAVAIEPVPPGTEQLHALGRFLAGGEPEPGLLLVPDQVPMPSAAAVAGPSARPAWFKDTWGWVLVGGGFAVAGAGAGLLISGSGLADDARGASDDAEAKDLFERSDSRRTMGAILLPIGAAAIIAGVLKFTLRPRRARTEKAASGLSVGLGTLGWEGAF